MEDHQRLIKINNELNKLNSIIEITQSQNQALLQLLNNCQHSTPSSSSSFIINQRSKSRSLSEMFEGTDSKHTVFLPDNNLTDSFEFNECSSIIKKKSKQSSKKISNIFQKSNFSTQTVKEPQIQKLNAKNNSTGIKKNKLQKSNIPKSKNKMMEKDNILCEQQKSGKITRIKSEKKFLNNNKSSIKFSLNLNTINKQKTVGLKKQKLGKNNLYETIHENENVQIHKTYASTKMETLNSKRSKGKHSSMANKQKILQHMNTMRNSKHKYQIELQKEVHSKIKGLKLKKNLCEVEGRYLKTAIKITKQEIERTLECSTNSQEENLIRFFILKTIMKFVSQIKNHTGLNLEPMTMNQTKNEINDKKREKLIQAINKLPEIVSKNQQISQFSYREFTEQKMFIEQKISNLSSPQSVTKQILFVYLLELFEFIQFLLKNNLIVLAKNGDKIPICCEGFFSDRSAKRQVGNGTKENEIFVPKKKEFSQRKHDKNVTLKRANTAKVLKKSTTVIKARLV